MERKCLFRIIGFAAGITMIGSTIMYNLGFAQPATTLVPSFSISAEYNDNIFSQSKDRQGDFITRIQPKLDFAHLGRRTDLTANYGPGLEIFARNTGESRPFHNLSVALAHRYSPKLNLSFSDTFSLASTTVSTIVPVTVPTTAPTTVPAGQVRLTEVQVSRTTVTTNYFNAGAGYQLTPSTSADFALAYSLTRFKAPQLIDSDSFSISSGISHQLTRKARVNGNLRFLFLSVENGPDTPAFSFSLGANHDYSPTLTFFSNLGSNFSLTSGSRSTGIFTSNGLTKTFRTSTLTLSFGRDLTTGTGLQGTSTAQRGSIAFNHQLTREATWDTGLTYSTSKPEGGGSEVKAAIGSAGFNYTISRYVSLRIFYSLTVQEQDRDRSSRITINRAGAILQVALPSLI